MPTTNPSAIPSDIPSTVPSKLTRQCHDNKEFHILGLDCIHFSFFAQFVPCSKIGIGKVDVKAVMANCPRTCGYCDTGAPSSLLSVNPSKLIMPSVVPTYTASASPSYNPTQSATIVPHDKHSISLSFIPSYSPTSQCQDNARFRILGFDCEEFKFFLELVPCSKIDKLGIHKMSITEVMTNCPQTCGYCDTMVTSLNNQ